MNEFKAYHPIVNFTYFVFVIGFSCIFLHPVCLGISLMCGFVYSVILKGKRAIKRNLTYMLPMLIIMAIINPLFNHQGVTILQYLPNGKPITLEAIAYGISTALMIACVLFHFSCYNEVMTEDKFIFLFGRIMPAMSLIISMTLRFVPKFAAQLKVVINAQRCMGRDISGGSIINRAKHGLNILSVMTTWALENSIDTADSMKARGYGIPGRTAFSIYIFDKRDKKALVCILLSGIYVFAGNLMGGMTFEYFPSIQQTRVSLFEATLFAAYCLLCMYPIIIELREARRWNALKPKI